MKDYIQRIIEGYDLSQAEMNDVFDLIMTGLASPSQIAGFITALRMKGETVEEITGAALSMRRYALFIDTRGLPVVDTCGTGGDRTNTFNISTTAAFVTAGADVPVAKHGNRAISSRCGSADVLAELGVNIEASPEVVEECICEVGIGFLYAPKVHPAMKYASLPRKELGIRTIFNMLGPLTNPAGAKGQILGVFSSELTETFARVLKLLGCKRAFVVHGHDGMDEITSTTTTRVSELNSGEIRTYEFDPLQYISDYSDLESLQGGDPAINAAIIRRILSGDRGSYRDVVCLNAAAAIVAGGKANNLSQGMELAQDSIDSGKAKAMLENLVEHTKR
jgi:anthranilate phosphoribosyltransferase